MTTNFDQVNVEEVLAKIEYYTELAQKYEQLAKEARAEKQRWRGQLAPARRRAKKAIVDALPKRPRGRPFRQYVLSAEERQRRHKLKQQAKRMSQQQPGVEVICVLKSR